MRHSNNKLLENLKMTVKSDLQVRRYNLSDMISESYKALYNCDNDTNLQKIVEAHLDDVRKNPSDIERLSRQLSRIKHVAKLIESNEMKDEELLVPKESHDTVEPKKERVLNLEESKDDEDVEEKDDEDVIDESTHDEDVEEKDDEDLLEDDELTDEELEELAKHLESIRKNKNMKECDSKKPMAETTKPRKLKRANESAPALEESKSESKTYESLDLSDFTKKSATKAFVKTFKKLDPKLHEGTALTRQESISLYKAANSAMTHLSVELEHNPEFLSTFKESVSLLSVDVSKLLESLKEGKAPSKANMKSLAKFSEALLREAEEDEEELPPIEDEEDIEISDEEVELSPEEEEFLQDYADAYADAREEIHDELEDKYGESDDEGVQARLEQDAAEVAELKGEDEEEEEASEESEEDPVEDADDDITDDELAELKKHLMEMRKAKRVRESEESADTLAQVKKALSDAGISYSTLGKNKDRILVSKSDLKKASEIRDEIDTKVYVGSRA